MSKDIKTVPVGDEVTASFEMYRGIGKKSFLASVADPGQVLMACFEVVTDYRIINTAVMLGGRESVRISDLNSRTTIELHAPYPSFTITKNGLLGGRVVGRSYDVVPVGPYGHKVRLNQLKDKSALKEPIRVMIDGSKLGFYVFALLSLRNQGTGNWQIARIVPTQNFDSGEDYPLARAICNALKE